MYRPMSVSRTNQIPIQISVEKCCRKLLITILTPQSIGYLKAGKRQTCFLQDKISKSKPQRALQR